MAWRNFWLEELVGFMWRYVEFYVVLSEELLVFGGIACGLRPWGVSWRKVSLEIGLETSSFPFEHVGHVDWKHKNAHIPRLQPLKNF